MKTTIDLPDDLVKEIKIRAVQEDRSFKDLFAELLKCGLKESSHEPRRVKFPLITGTRPAKPGEEATPEVVAKTLLEEDVARALRQ